MAKAVSKAIKVNFGKRNSGKASKAKNKQNKNNNKTYKINNNNKT
jgi:hypothetical protein